MLFVAVCAILALAFYFVGLTLAGAYLYAQTRDWHYLAGTILYTCGNLVLFWWLFNGLI